MIIWFGTQSAKIKKFYNNSLKKFPLPFLNSIVMSNINFNLFFYSWFCDDHALIIVTKMCKIISNNV